MATVFLEGFDHYGIPGQNNPSFNTTFAQEWTSMGGMALTAGLSSTGYAITGSPSNGGVSMNKTLPGNYSRLIGGFRFNIDLRSNVGITFTDAGTAQSSITINSGTGTICMRNAYLSNTALGTSTASVAANTTHYLEFDVTFGASAAFQVWLDGASVISGTGNTKTTGNSYCNGIMFSCLAFSAVTYTYDDIYLFDTTGSYNNSVLLTNPRIETQYPSGDSQTQWTNAGHTLVAAGITETSVSNITTATNAPGAGQLALVKVTPAVNCTINSVSVLPAATSASAKFKAVVYSDSSGPASLISGSTTEVTGCTSGTSLALAFNSPQALTASTSYWIGYITDTSVALSQYDNSTNLGQKKPNTYASGAPSGPLSGMTTAQPTWQVWGNCTGATTNWKSVAQMPAAGTGPAVDGSTITSLTVGNEDLYSFPALTTTPAVVHAVDVKVNAKLSGTGSRTLDMRMKSSGTDSAGSTSGQAVSTNYAWYTSHFDRDPNGSIAWTKTSVDSAVAGPKVNT